MHFDNKLADHFKEENITNKVYVRSKTSLAKKLKKK